MIACDESEWPLIIFHHDGTITDEEIEIHLKDFDRFLDRHEPFTWVSIVDATGSMTARQRAKLTSHQKARYNELGKYVRGAAMVLESSLARGITTALTWMVKYPFEFKTFARAEDAKTWALGRVPKILP